MSVISSITYVKDLGRSTPAAINRATGHLIINLAVWNQIRSKEHRLFILLHEYAHAYLNTSDERKVDAYAFKLYTEVFGLSLKESVRALTTVLNAKNPEHAMRAYLQLQRAKEYDYKVNGNKKVYENEIFSTIQNLNKMCEQDSSCQCSTLPMALRSFDDDFAGCQPNEKPGQCKRRIKVESKAIARENRSEGSRLKGEAKATLAQQGIVDSNGWDKVKGVVGSVGDAAKSILGKGGGDDGQAGASGPAPEKDKTMLYVGIGAGFFVLVGILIFVFKR